MGQFSKGWRWGEMLGLLLLALALMVLWRLPVVGMVLYPFVLLKTFIHEIWHGIAAILTGGSFERMEIYADTSGKAWSRGGTRWIVASAGYLGTSFTGAALIVLAARGLPSRALLGALGALMILLSVTLVGNAFGRVSGLGIGAGLLVAAIYLGRTWRDGLLLVLAAAMVLDAINSLLVLTRLSLGSEQHTDAATMAELTGIPALIWAGLWIALSVLMLLLALRLAFRGSTQTSAMPGAPVRR